MIYRTKVESKELFGCQTVTFNDVEDIEYNVIYIHGGIYVNEIKLPHIIFCDKLAKKNQCVRICPYLSTCPEPYL